MEKKVEYIQRSLRIPKELYEQATATAKKECRTLANLITFALKEYLDKKSKESK